MRYLAIIVFLFFNVAMAFSTTYYVATSGSDNNSGTSKSAPFATLQHANDVVKQGDVVYIRGGHYYFNNKNLIYTNPSGKVVDKARALYAGPTILSTSGTSKSIIKYCNFPNEKPIFDFYKITEKKRITGILVTGSYIELKGIEIIHCPVNLAINHTQSECVRNLGNNNRYERLTMHDSEAIGFYLSQGANNLVYNCDAYNLCDTTSGDGSGENSDGFGCHPHAGGIGNIIKGCRAWFCADDGFDCINAFEAVTFEECWALYNGYTSEFKSKANGNGIKGGGYGLKPTRLPHKIPTHIIKQCLSVGNKANGFYANHHPGGTMWLNNLAYDNGVNFNMLGGTVSGERGHYYVTNCDGYNICLKNNISYYGQNKVSSIHSSGKDIINLNEQKSINDHNSFSLNNISISDNDFQSLNLSLLTSARDSGGNLPDITCLHLKSSSKMINAGTDSVEGISFSGKAPDLGCFIK